MANAHFVVKCALQLPVRYLAISVWFEASKRTFSDAPAWFVAELASTVARDLDTH